MKMYFPRCWISLFPLYQFHGLTFLCHLMVDLGSFVISRVDLRSFVISGVDLRLSSQGWIYVKWHHSIFQLLIGYFKEGRSGSVKNKTTRREGNGVIPLQVPASPLVVSFCSSHFRSRLLEVPY